MELEECGWRESEMATVILMTLIVIDSNDDDNDNVIESISRSCCYRSNLATLQLGYSTWGTCTLSGTFAPLKEYTGVENNNHIVHCQTVCSVHYTPEILSSYGHTGTYKKVKSYCTTFWLAGVYVNRRI